MFTQSLQNKVLHASDTLDYDADLAQRARRASTPPSRRSRARTIPMEQRTDFVVR